MLTGCHCEDCEVQSSNETRVLCEIKLVQKFYVRVRGCWKNPHVKNKKRCLLMGQYNEGKKLLSIREDLTITMCYIKTMCFNM